MVLSWVQVQTHMGKLRGKGKMLLLVCWNCVHFLIFFTKHHLLWRRRASHHELDSEWSVHAASLSTVTSGKSRPSRKTRGYWVLLIVSVHKDLVICLPCSGPLTHCYSSSHWTSSQSHQWTIPLFLSVQLTHSVGRSLSLCSADWRMTLGDSWSPGVWSLLLFPSPLCSIEQCILFLATKRRVMM